MDGAGRPRDIVREGM